jgi:hypothetical protein
MYLAVRAYMSKVHEQQKENVVEIDGFVAWLKWNHPLVWYRSGFNTYIKCDYITNNIADVFNNWVKDHKNLTVYEFADKSKLWNFFLKGEGLERSSRGRFFLQS